MENTPKFNFKEYTSYEKIMEGLGIEPDPETAIHAKFQQVESTLVKMLKTAEGITADRDRPDNFTAYMQVNKLARDCVWLRNEIVDIGEQNQDNPNALWSARMFPIIDYAMDEAMDYSSARMDAAEIESAGKIEDDVTARKYARALDTISSVKEDIQNGSFHGLDQICSGTQDIIVSTLNVQVRRCEHDAQRIESMLEETDPAYPEHFLEYAASYADHMEECARVVKSIIDGKSPVMKTEGYGMTQEFLEQLQVYQPTLQMIEEDIALIDAIADLAKEGKTGFAGIVEEAKENGVLDGFGHYAQRIDGMSFDDIRADTKESAEQARTTGLEERLAEQTK